MNFQKARKHRNLAAQKQAWLCYYCGLPMGGPGSPYIDSIESSRPALQASAEHLTARAQGGKETSQNIVAAHIFCNRQRHRPKRPPDPQSFSAKVKRRIQVGRWFCPWDLALLRQALRSERRSRSKG